MRRTVSVLLLATVAAMTVSAAAATPEALFDLGLRAFRAGDYASAVVDLNDASRQVDPASPTHHTALVYLALAQFRLGMEEAARDTILRLVEAERATPAYATLNLGPDAADFETLVAALAPETILPHNAMAAAPSAIDDPSVALPSVRPATTPAAVEATTEVRIEEIQKEADRRIAEIEADADRRIAAAQAAANERVAAAQASADQRVAVAIQQAQRDADARIAAINRQADTRIAEIPSGAQGSQPAAVAETEPRRAETPAIRRDDAAALTTLRQAESMATSGDREAARELYVRVAANPNAPREVLGEAGTGLYRIGAWRESADAFRRLGTFARGEEDLRYYFAVALYESGDYREAQRELACALPFIQRTEDVERYRLRIEQTMAVNLTRR